jgi:hypothetical protein
MTPSGGAVSPACCSGTETVSGSSPTGAVSGSSAAGAAWPRLWIGFQIRDTAVARSLNFFNWVSPGRLFQISTSRAAGRLAASFASAASLPNLSEFRKRLGVLYRAVDSDVVRFVFNRKVLHFQSLGAVITAITTFIDQVRGTSKQNVYCSQ